MVAAAIVEVAGGVGLYGAVDARCLKDRSEKSAFNDDGDYVEQLVPGTCVMGEGEFV